MTPLQEAEIKAFVKERDEMLLALDIDRCIEFQKKHSPGMPFSSRSIVEASMHKARTACLSLPKSERKKSKQWLKEHNMDSMPLDDGDLDD